MNNLLKYLSLAPVLFFLWMSATAAVIIIANYLYPDALFFPSIF